MRILKLKSLFFWSFYENFGWRIFFCFVNYFHQIKNTHTCLDAFYIANILDVWFARFTAVLRLIETTGESYTQLAETEAVQFGPSNHANFYKQFFPQKYPEESGTLVPFGLRLIVLQILVKCGHAIGSYIGGHISDLLTLKVEL